MTALPMTIAQNLSTAQQQTIINIVRRAARSEIMPRFRNLSKGDIATKSSPSDLVTIADQRSERMITRGLAGQFANALIVGEEAVAQDPELVKKLPDAELAFVIDPIDGTWNFTHSLGVFGVIIAATRFGVPIFGLLYDPVMDDYVISGAEEKTRYATGPRKVQVCTTSIKEQARHLRGIYHTGLMSKAQRETVGALFPQVGSISNLHCSCHEYRLLARGHYDFCITINPKPWDHLAGALAVRQAGGVSRMLSGADYSAAEQTGILLTAGNEALWKQLADHFSALA